MKKLLLILVIILISSNAYSDCWFNCDEEPKLEDEKIIPAKKKCYYKIVGRNGYYAVIEIEQMECTGARIAGKVSGNIIIEYDQNMIESNRQSPRDRKIFDKKIESLWPDMKEIKTSP